MLLIKIVSYELNPRIPKRDKGCFFLIDHNSRKISYSKYSVERKAFALI